MAETTIREFAECMKVLEMAHNRSMKPEQIQIWHECLRDIPIPALREAIVRHLREGDDWPSIAKLRRFAGDVPADKRAAKAWAVVRSSISKHGAYRSIEFDDPIANAAVRSIGGWAALCERNIDELKWAEQEFRRSYESLHAAGVNGDQCGPLPGLLEIESSRQGIGEVEHVRVPVGLPGTQRVLPAPKATRRIEQRRPVLPEMKSAVEPDEPEDTRPGDDELEQRRAQQLQALENGNA